MSWADTFVPPVSNKPLYTPILPQFRTNFDMNNTFPSYNFIGSLWNCNNNYMWNMPNYNTSFYGNVIDTPEIPYSDEGWDDFSTKEKLALKMSEAEKKQLIEQEKNDKRKEHKKEHNVFTALAFSIPFMSAPVIKGFYKKANKPTKDMFYELDKVTGKAKYEPLFQKAPTIMQEAQAELNKAGRKYHRAVGHNASATANDYNNLKKLMEDALKTGDPQKVAEATEQLRVANSRKYRYSKLGKGSFKTKLQAARSADLSKVVAKKGNSYKQHIGGKMGWIGTVAFFALSLFGSKNDIKEAYGIDKKTGNKQLLQSSLKATSAFTFLFGDALGKWLTTKFISKGATKLATKLVAKGAGKAIGAAVGSIIPGIGTIAGVLIGTVADVLVSRFVIPLICGDHNSALENKQIEAKSSEELFMGIAEKKLNGGDLSKDEQRIFNKNKDYYDFLVEEARKAQLEQGKTQ